VFSIVILKTCMYKVRFNITKVYKDNHEFKSVTQGKEVMNKVAPVKYFGLTTK
jgi:hypothetical protein